MGIAGVLNTAGLALAGVCLARWTYSLVSHRKVMPDITQAAIGLLLLVLLDVRRLKPGTNHTVGSLVRQYVVSRVLYGLGCVMSKKLFKHCMDVKKLQEEVLRSILEVNKNTKVAEHFQLKCVETVEDFKKKMPLTTYCDYEEFSLEVREKGSENVFFPGRADYVAVTSGTTSGKSKHFPKSMKIMRRTIGKWIILAQKCSLDIKGNNYLRKWLVIKAKPETWLTKSGIITGPFSGFATKFSMNPTVVPEQVNQLSNEEDVIYLNLVFGLKISDICNLYFSTSQMALLFFQVLERRWEEICDDIQQGEVTKNLNKVPDDIRKILSFYLNGRDKQRADFLRREIRKGMKHIVPRIWPECPGLFCAATGSFKTQADFVRDRYLGPVPLFSPYHTGTETFYGINLDLEDKEISYTATAPFNFFEFIPESKIDEDNPETCLCHQLTVGEQYEIVVTTHEGLYRYRTEDLVEITGFRGTIPKYKFVRRKGDILSAYIERVPETVLASAVREAVKKCGKQVTDFASSENIHIRECTSETPYYVVFLELQGDHVLTEEEKLLVDEELMQLHEVYSRCRQNNKLRPVKVVQLQTGTVDNLAKEIIRQNDCTVATQYKMPRVIRRLSLLNFLLDQRVENVK